MRRRGGRLRRWVSVLMLLLLVGGGIFAYRSKAGEERRFVKALGAGWNLGNTLDVHNLHKEADDPTAYETYWNNPPTTPELFSDVKAAGFDLVRIPVTWYEHMDEDLQVDGAWLDRVQQVVDEALAAGLSVIINAHHDPWYTPLEPQAEEAEVWTRALWGQLALRFREYDESLLFESMNEPRLIGTEREWGDGTPEAREIVNRLNEVFVETVRASGGENSGRYLLLPTYCARTGTDALEGFRMPEGERLIVSLHLYEPYGFTHQESGSADFSPDSEKDTRAIDQTFRDVERLFACKGIPVIITEFGARDKDNEDARIRWARYILEAARPLGIPCVWWDAGGRPEEEKSFSLYDRYGRVWLFPDLTAALTE